MPSLMPESVRTCRGRADECSNDEKDKLCHYDVFEAWAVSGLQLGLAKFGCRPGRSLSLCRCPTSVAQSQTGVLG